MEYLHVDFDRNVDGMLQQYLQRMHTGLIDMRVLSDTDKFKFESSAKNRVG